MSQSKDVDNGEQNRKRKQIRTERQIGDKKFRLFQLVKASDPIGSHNIPETYWIVTDLEDGVTLSTTDFEFRSEHEPTKNGVSTLKPQTTETGIPMFGY